MINEMRCVIKENLEAMNLSIRSFAEKVENIPGAPSYSTIDNFIRKGTGNLETAWVITALMGLTLNDNFVSDDSDPGAYKKALIYSESLEATIKTIIDAIRKIEKITKPDDVAAILFAIGKSIESLGYNEDAGYIINMGAEYIKMKNKEGNDNG